jgi:protein-disulfide isomerase
LQKVKKKNNSSEEVCSSPLICLYYYLLTHRTQELLVNKFFSLIVILTLFAIPLPAKAEGEAPLTKSDVTSLIEQYIRENPQVIISSLEQHQRDQEVRAEEQATQKLSEHQEFLASGDLPRVGNAEGDIKIVEFYDYNCGYCKKAFADLQILLEADKNVQITFVEMPILGESSLEAAKWAEAAIKQDKFFDFHSALMKFSGQKTEESMKALAEAAGLDVAALTEAAKDPAIIDRIQKNISVANDIGIRGTPGFVVNGKIYRGYLGYDGLKAVIDEIRLSNAPAPAATPEAAPVAETPEGQNG